MNDTLLHELYNRALVACRRLGDTETEAVVQEAHARLESARRNERRSLDN